MLYVGISSFLLFQCVTGQLLELATGEGKTVVIALFAAIKAICGSKVDIACSSSHLGIMK